MTRQYKFFTPTKENKNVLDTKRQKSCEQSQMANPWKWDPGGREAEMERERVGEGGLWM